MKFAQINLQVARVVLAIVAGTMLLPQVTQADVKLPKVFDSHMVLQRDQPVVIWGWAKPGEAVSVQISQDKQETKANEKGEWKVTLAPLKIGGPLSIIVRGANTITLEDVLVGDVWVCSGQSNMEMGVKQVLNADQEVAAANYPQIRLFLIPKKASPAEEKDVDAQWKACTPAAIVEGGWGGFSAAAYFFGRELHKTLQVPVGLIATSWGGTRIEPWTPPEGFAAVPALKPLYDTVLLGNVHSPAHKQGMERFTADVEKWVTNARQAAKNEQPVPALPAMPADLQSPQNHVSPTALYNGMVAPIVPFAVRGAIWYQGESNHTEKDYAEKMRALITGWRNVWRQPELPFYYVQIAPFQYGTETPGILPAFWEQQTAALAIPHTGMAVIHDVGDIKDIHPRNKQEVGRRLALLALAKTYGKTDVVCSGPMFQRLAIEGNKLRVTFSEVAGGLASRDGKPLSHFEIIDADKGGFVPAQAEISGASVVLSAPQVAHPIAVRFAWHKTAEPNLMNKAGLPANPFRAGNVPVRDLLALNVPEAKAYQLVYDLDLTQNGGYVKYAADNHAQITKPFSRIAYFLELQTGEEDPQYVYVSMDAFTTDAGKIGVPIAQSKAFFQQTVKNMNVLSNVKGIVTGNGIATGNIEFWPNNYGPPNSKKIPGASDGQWDFGDEPVEPTAGYGSMQIHNYGAKQTLLAFNNFGAGNFADLGIGNAPTGNPDWTFAKSAGNYTTKRLRVLVLGK